MTAKAQKANPISLKQLQNLYDTFREETDRGAAIVGAAYLDESLKELVASFLIDDEQVDELLRRALRSFGLRIVVAYSLGLISADEYSDLDTIRDIRNDFAHGRTKTSFSEPEIEGKCDGLILWRPFSEVLALESARSRFVFTTTTLLMQLGIRVLRAKQERRVTPTDFEVAEIVR